MHRHHVALLAFLPLVAHAEFAAPVPAPVDRLIANIERQLIGRPNDGDLNYRRGRLYALKAVQKEVHVFGDVESNFKVLSKNEAVLDAEPTEAAKTALKTSIASYKSALKAAPNDAAFQLGLAWALEAAARLKLEGVAARDAQAAYKKAFELAKAGDDQRKERPLSLGGVFDLISYEAGSALVRLSGPGDDEVFIGGVRQHLAKLKALPPPRAVTPIIFSRSGKDALAQLEDRARCSTFDLDGTARGTCWSWLSPGAGVLVWDPSGKGEVKNGWQLFGSVSFFVFFHHGYEALAALDDDGDGWLSGQELPGLAVWADANRDGQPQPSEVQSVGALGIRRIAAKGVQRADGLWHQPRGLQFSDGSFRPTWDWISQPQQPSTLTPGAQP